MYETIISYMGVILVSTALCHFISNILLLHRLKRDHTKVWMDLGEPSIFWNNSMRNGFRVMGFVFRRDNLNDKTLKSLKVAVAVFFILFTLMVFATIAIALNLSLGQYAP